MSPYSVAQHATGDWTWWVNWEAAALNLDVYKNIRPATIEEAELMDRVVWQTATPLDRVRLKSLIAGSS